MAETDDDDTFFLGEDGLIHCPTRVQVRMAIPNDDDDEVSGNALPLVSRDFCNAMANGAAPTYMKASTTKMVPRF
ncbi:hypothetical protein CCACVL1_24407 [Corchorus capsularis]|uniref:Uncharacterized protein n=1 Tax=Corchorus capsularis TaxID=210143 RepID=A0A1R3GPU0_COCAP|nr:hypothetical protein CCACVL1_24407 [Corchorus capsularis]